MKNNKAFNPATLAAKIYKERALIFARIRNKHAIERYLISTRSRRDFVDFYTVRLKSEHADQLYRYLTGYMGRNSCPTIAKALNRIKKITNTITKCAGTLISPLPMGIWKRRARFTHYYCSACRRFSE